jgi:hypothetical protein
MTPIAHNSQMKSPFQQQDKPFRDALDMELWAAGKDHKALRCIARRLIAKAQAGDVRAIMEVAGRMDGKVPQAAMRKGEHDQVRTFDKIEIVIVDPKKADGVEDSSFPSIRATP